MNAKSYFICVMSIVERLKSFNNFIDRHTSF